MKRIKRSIEGMLYSLRAQTELLKEYYYKAFVEKNTHYLGEVAGKLRILVIEEGKNKALLLKLMDEFNDNIEIQLAIPPTDPYPTPDTITKENKISVRDFLNLNASVDTKSGEKKTITKKDLIKKWSQQLGAAHQDWEIEEDFHDLLQQNILIFGIPIAGLELKETARTILSISEEFLKKHVKDFKEIKSIDEKWHPIVKLKGLGKEDDGKKKAYFFWIENKDLLKKDEDSTIMWFKEEDNSIFRLRKDKNIKLVFEQIQPEKMMRHCDIFFDKIKEDTNYFIKLIWNDSELKLIVGYEDRTWIESK